MPRTIRSLFLFGAPVFVGLLNLFHPTHFDYNAIYDGLHAVTLWWITLHVLNLFGFSALGLAAYLLVLEQHGPAAVLAKTAILLFVPTYVAFDSIIGIGTGILMRYGNSLPAVELSTLKETINAYWNSNISTLLAIAGSVAWNVAMGASAVSFSTARRGAAVAIAILASPFTGWGYASGVFGTLPWWIGVLVIGLLSFMVVRPRLPYTLLILAGILLGTSHVPPFGPFGMACFLVAATALQWEPGRVRMREVSASRA